MGERTGFLVSFLLNQLVLWEVSSDRIPCRIDYGDQ